MPNIFSPFRIFKDEECTTGDCGETTNETTTTNDNGTTTTTDSTTTDTSPNTIEINGETIVVPADMVELCTCLLYTSDAADEE